MIQMIKAGYYAAIVISSIMMVVMVIIGLAIIGLLVAFIVS